MIIFSLICTIYLLSLLDINIYTIYYKIVIEIMICDSENKCKNVPSQ